MYCLLLLLGTLSAGGPKVTPLPDSTAGRLVAEPRVLIIAHRGDSKVAPENTLPAFESAVKVGSDLVELDYVHTADGVPIVIHDVTLDRTTDAEKQWPEKRIRVDSKKLAELEKLDAGSWFDAKFQGTKLPTLEASLDLIQKGSMTLIERKEGDAKTCIDLLERKSLLDRVVIQAFDWDYLADCRKLRQDVVLGALGSGKLDQEVLDRIVATGAQAVGWQFTTLRQEQIDLIHERGLKAWAWTVDKDEYAERLIDWGIDAIITNRPAAMKELLNKPRRVPMDKAEAK